MQQFKTFVAEGEAIDKAKAKLKKIKKGTEVSFTHHKTGQKVTGTYQGLKRMGAHSYAHVETDKEAHRVPVHHIHQAQ